ncbi:MAG: lytic transglycosylase domain-containing protein [Sporomusaceae bacterium]|nr:lytic transglycosylase domain-containing protein [Sporomusaceae bacterium]
MVFIIFRKFTFILCCLLIFSGAVEAAPNQSDSDYVKSITRYIGIVNRTSDGAADYIARCIVRSARNHQVDPLLLTSLIAKESSFRPDAVSRSGAMGLGQLMPATAASVGVADPFDIAENVEGSARYFSQMLQQFAWTNQPVSFALAAYNAGPTTVRRYGAIPPFPETQNYVRQISRNYEILLQMR